MKQLTLSILLFIGTTLFITSCSDDEDGGDNGDGDPCTETLWYQDADGDGLGNPDVMLSACEQPDGYVADNSDDDDTDDGSGTPTMSGTPLTAFDEFNPDAVTVSFDGDQVTLESNGLPNHTSPYWNGSNPLYIERVVGTHSSPGTIRRGNFTLTVPTAPEIAPTTTATGLGAIGLSVTGVPIFNDQEGPNLALDAITAGAFDYAGGHNGPSGYHYHVESYDVEENTVLSHDDDALVGIMLDGFLLYGRRDSATGDYPTDLDVSGGHVGPTQHSNGAEFYHYHIINEYYVDNFIVLFGVDLQGTASSMM